MTVPPRREDDNRTGRRPAVGGGKLLPHRGPPPKLVPAKGGEIRHHPGAGGGKTPEGLGKPGVPGSKGREDKNRPVVLPDRPRQVSAAGYPGEPGRSCPEPPTGEDGDRRLGRPRHQAGENGALSVVEETPEGVGLLQNRFDGGLFRLGAGVRP